MKAVPGEHVTIDLNDPARYWSRPEHAEYCGVYWIITTCLTGIALGLGLGALLWLVLS